MDFLIYIPILMTVIEVISAKIDGWDTSPNTQYHIQTDEGPERYFKYQTMSGQYRKEKRLQDGTVVGSYGWVDADGFLRLNDYIADNEGYRITRSKRLYVGSQAPIDASVNQAKYVPPQAGTDVSSSPWNGARGSPAVTRAPFNISPEYSVSPTPSTASPYSLDRSKFLLFPSSSQSPVPHYYRKSPTPPAGYYPTSTIPPVAVYRDGDHRDAEVAITPSYYVPSSTEIPYNYHKVVPSYKSPLYTSVVKSPGYSRPNDIGRTPDKPIYQNRRVFTNEPQQASSENQEQLAEYDGVAVTRNGFRYYLPRHYHEEENLPDETKAGSFGYIDPFGIRRVVYYNASPGSGFVHRKNNRYVGFDATPYDPRPSK